MYRRFQGYLFSLGVKGLRGGLCRRAFHGGICRKGREFPRKGCRIFLHLKKKIRK